jgi:hypothetical protein
MLVLADKKEKGEVSIKELKEVFSVEALNKDFFKTYKAHYEKFAKYLADEENPLRENLIDKEKDTKDKQEKPIRDFVKKLLGRIVFLQFLEKKGWMGCDANTQDWTGGNPRFMFQLFEDFSLPEKFHSQCLTKLFFETLNTKRPNDIFEIKGLNGKLNGSRVPYLNGGLFEPEKNKATLAIDFPADYFKELLEFFDQYNFTIDENSPDDHEVGIDPEMLGHIFENLLEDNRDKGAFYTPKEIVQYMCKESLIQYLLNTFQEQKDIEQFIRLHIVSPFLAEKENAILLNQKLDDIKVCDPAIGSGAFPIGMLQEIFEAKRFIYPHLKTNEPFNPAEVKKNIIQNSIYGVDLEKGAVDIAQLRFWLSLVVDELNPHPLPNLDYKIMQGNSLLEEFGGFKLDKLMDEEDSIIASGVQQLSLGSDFDAPKFQLEVFDRVTKEELWKLMEKFYDPVAWEKKTAEKVDKTQTKKDINDIIEGKIHAFVLSEQRKLRDEILQKKKDWNIKDEDYSKLNQKSKDYKKFVENVAKLEQLNNLENQLLKLHESEEKPFFLWHTWFKKDVFEKGGFDVMIGNPPYIQLAKMKDVIDVYQEAGFETFARTGDIYCLFYEKGIDLLKKNEGVLSYITSNSWMKTKYGESLRKFFVEKTNPIKILNFEDTQIFPSATVEANILISKRQKYTKETESVALKQDVANQTIQIYFDNNKVILNDLSEEEWVLLSKPDFIIKSEIEKNPSLKSLDYKIISGVKTGLNEAYLIDEELRNELVLKDSKNKEIIRPIIRGRDISKYNYSFNEIYCIFTHNGNISMQIPAIDCQNDYPTIYEYLLSFDEKIVNRPSQGRHWSNVPTNYLKEFNSEKLIWGELSDKPKFAYDNSSSLTEATVFNLTGNNIKFILTILNSKLCQWYFETFTTTSGMGTNRWKKYKMEKIPIANPKEDIKKIFECIAEYLIYLNDPKQAPVLEKVSNEAVSQVFEDLVNMMVYELYFEEEMKAKEIDVLQFVTEKAFPDITQAEDKKAIIQKVYYELQQKDNPIRNRILVASSRSETIARINAATS